MTSFQKFRLRWNNHTSNFLGSLGALLNSENYSDVTVCCEGHVWQLHRLVLSASSSHFEHLLNSIPAGLTPAIILDGPSSSDIEALIHFIYHGEVSVDQTRLPSLLRTASSLNIKGLADVASFTQTEDGSHVVKFVTSPENMAVEPTHLEDQTPLNLSCHADNRTDLMRVTSHNFELGKRKHEHEYILKGGVRIDYPLAKKLRHSSEASNITTATQTRSPTAYPVSIRPEGQMSSGFDVPSRMKTEPIGDFLGSMALGSQAKYREVVYVEDAANIPVVLGSARLPGVAVVESPGCVSSTIPYQPSSILPTHSNQPIMETALHAEKGYSRCNAVSMKSEDFGIKVQKLESHSSKDVHDSNRVTCETTFNHKKFSPCSIPNTTPTSIRGMYNNNLLTGSSYKVVSSSEAQSPDSTLVQTSANSYLSTPTAPLVSQIPRLANTIDEMVASSPPSTKSVSSPVENQAPSPHTKNDETGFKSPSDSSDEHCSDFAVNQNNTTNDGSSANSQRTTINMRTFKEEWRKQLLVDYDPRTNMSICMLCFTTFKSYDGPRKNTYVKHAKRFHPALDNYSDEEREVIISMYEKYHKYDIDMQKEINKTFRAPNGPGCLLKRSSKIVDASSVSVCSNGASRRDSNPPNDYVPIKEEKIASPSCTDADCEGLKQSKSDVQLNNNEIEPKEQIGGKMSARNRKMISTSVSASA